MVAREQGYAPTVVEASGLDLPICGVGFPSGAGLNSQREAPTAAELLALTKAIRRGDEAAFARFYDLYSFRLYKFLLVLARGDENEAREVCQAVMIKLARRFAVFADEQKLWAWLRALSRNAFIDYCRARSRRRRLVSLEELAPEPRGAEQADHHLTEILREALAGLQPDERELLQAAYVDERALQELADASGQTYKAVESRLARLRHKLKTQVLNQLRHEPEP
jgi:RNA polymerase sigma-70 factor, ECF subfamily